MYRVHMLCGVVVVVWKEKKKNNKKEKRGGVHVVRGKELCTSGGVRNWCVLVGRYW